PPSSHTTPSLHDALPILPKLDDTFEYHGQIMADNVAYFAGLVKKASQGRLLTGAFYGYHLFVTDPRRGHGSLSALLQCPDLDYLDRKSTRLNSSHVKISY